MKILLTIIFLSLLSSPSWSVFYSDLVVRDGIYYKKFSDVPFSGEISGKDKGSIKNGKKEGEWVYYYSNGQLDFKGNYKNGKEEGEWISYFSNGQLRYKGNYKNGEREGKWVYYFSDGHMNPSNTGTYKNGMYIRQD